MAFETIELLRPLRVDALVTIHYFEYASSYSFEGERHDFWEFLYVDKGEVDVVADTQTIRLTRGQIIFHQPGEFHALRANGVVAPNLVVAAFHCQGQAMDFFRGLVTGLEDEDRPLLARLVEEGERAFSTPLNDPNTTALTRRSGAPFGAEALLACALEELLVRLVRRNGAPPTQSHSFLHNSGDQALFVRISRFLEENLDRRLTLELICHETLVGRSRLQQLFRTHTGGGVMEYVGRLRVESAKGMIRAGGQNFTEISAILGYQSVHYFSRHFKKVAGMTPSEYASSVKMLAGRHI